jgi:hypothetical protein
MAQLIPLPYLCYLTINDIPRVAIDNLPPVPPYIAMKVMLLNPSSAWPSVHWYVHRPTTAVLLFWLFRVYGQCCGPNRAAQTGVFDPDIRVANRPLGGLRQRLFFFRRFWIEGQFRPQMTYRYR